ncbi:MAG: radical SAM protein [Vicinamibacterales bacterium]
MTRGLRYAAHFLRYRFRDLHPFEVQAVLLNACNLRCRYCRCPEIPVPQMTTVQWVDALGRFARAGTLRVKFQGGEPTIRRDFAEIAAASRAAGIITAVVTNGLAIAERPALLDHLDEVVVSLDALTPARHDAWRGAGTHAPAVAALEAAAARGRAAYVNMVVHRDTLEEVEPMLEFCERQGYGLNAQAVMFGADYQDASARGEIGLTDAEERALYAQLARWRAAGRSLMFSAASYRRTSRWHDFRVLSIARDGPSRCMAGRDYLHVEANGDVHPCIVHTGPFTPRNLVRDGFEVAVRHARHHSCVDCSLAYLNERKALFGLRPGAVFGMLRR